MSLPRGPPDLVRCDLCEAPGERFSFEWVPDEKMRVCPACIRNIPRLALCERCDVWVWKEDPTQVDEWLCETCTVQDIGDTFSL